MPSDLLLRRPERSAHASIRGYLYQACLGALRWLELEPGEVLLCEGDEDLDRYFTTGHRTLEQVKDVSGTLGVTVVRETLRNFLLSWVHLRQQNESVRFVFTSTAEVGKGSPAWPILDGWEDPAGQDLRVDTVRAWVREAGGTEEDQDAVERGLEWLDQEDGWAEFLGSICWHLDQPEIQGMRDRIRQRLEARSDARDLPAENLVDRLVCEIFRASIEPGPIDRQRDGETLQRLIEGAKADLVQWAGSPEADRIRKTFDETQALGELLDSGELDLQELPSDRILPSRLLTAGYEVVPFVGRAEEWAEIQAWCEEPADKGVWLWSGEGGVGKSRFFIETCRRLRHQGWHAGFLPGHVDSSDIPDLFRGVLPRLVVIDYAETRPEITKKLLGRLARHEDEAKVRVVLLARQKGAWWEDLFKGSSMLQHLGYARARADTLSPLLEAEETRRESFQAAARHFARKLPDQPLPDPLVEPDLSRDEFQRILYLHMAALAALDGKRLDTAEDLLSATLEHEEGFWRRPGPNALEAADTVKLISRALAGFTLLGGVETEEQAGTWVPHLLDLANEPATVRFIRNQLHRLYGTREKYIEALQPDLLGEYLLEQVLRENDPLLHQVVDEASRAERVHLLIVLLRLKNRKGNDQGLEALGNWAVETNNLDGLEAMHQILRSVSFREAVPLFMLVEKIDAQAVKNHQKRFPKPSNDELFELADRWSCYGMALQNRQQFGKAIEALQEAVTIYRRLVKCGHANASAKLANSLNNLGMMNGESGRQLKIRGRTKHGQASTEKALRHTQEAVEIYHGLPDEILDKCLSGYALSLMNLGIWFGRLDRHQEAIEPSKKAVRLYRNLVKETSDALLPQLAQSLTNLGVQLLRIGQPEEALEANREAIYIYRRLAARRPEIFRRYLAGSYTNLGNTYIALDKPNEGHHAAAHSIDALLPLFKDNPDIFRVQMSNHWQNYLKHCERAKKEPRPDWAERLKDLTPETPKK